MGIFDRPDRPHVSLKMTPPETLVEIAALVGILGNFIVFIYYWPQFYEATADVATVGMSAGNIFIFLTVLPVMVYLITTLFGYFPRWFNYPVEITAENAPREYRLAANLMRCVKAEVALSMLIIEWVFVQMGIGEDVSFSPYFLVIFIGLLIVTMAYFIYEMYRQK